MSAKRQDYAAIDAEGADTPFEMDQGLLTALKWPRRPGLLSSMNSPSPFPSSSAEWIAFFTTTRGMPITHNLSSNLKSGATVACVNIALSISLALASGGTPTQGMICGFWASLLTGLLGGSHFNVVGTTSALSGMMNKLAIRYGELVLPTVSVYAAMFLLVFWALGVDRMMRYVATPVAHGFAIGVGIMIALGQLSSAFAIRGLPAQDGFVAKMIQFLTNMDKASPVDAALYFGSGALLFFLAFRWTKVPWVLVIAGLGIVIGMVSSGTGSAAHPSVFLLREKYPDIEMFLVAPNLALPTWIPIFGSAPGMNHCEGRGHARHCIPAGPELWQWQPDVWFYSFGCAVVSMLETLISAKIANRLLKGQPDYDLVNRVYSSSRESLGLAFTAFVCGITGSICPAAALARTALNLKSGAWSRVSGVLNALMLGAVAFAIMPYFEFLPFSFVGSILALVAYRLVDFDEMRTLRTGDPAGMYLCILTTVVCLFMDTFVGLIVGTLASLAMNRHVLRTLPIDVATEAHKFVEDGIHTTVSIRSAVTFANVDEADETLESVLLSTIEAGDRYYSVHLDVRECDEMDFDAMESLDEWGRKIKLTGTKLTIDRGIHLTRILRIAHNLRIEEEVKHVVPTASSARRGSQS